MIGLFRQPLATTIQETPMRLAAFSDIHGNRIALEAVLADIDAQGGADAYWVLGDLVAIGPEPVAVLERLAALPGAVFVRGNTDRYTLTGDRPYPSFDDVRADPDLLPRVVEVAVNFAWTRGAITGTGWYDWLAAIPMEQRLTLPDGARLLGVHSVPGNDDHPGFNPAMTDDEMRAVLTGCDADLVLAGHTHYAYERTLDGVRVVNLGPVANPLPPDLRASYVIIEAGASGHTLTRRRVAYDVDAALAAIEAANHPCASYLRAVQFGQHMPGWLKHHLGPHIPGGLNS
jgi:predicted phosphodiesterase